MDISVTPIDGIHEKLERAHENILNLDSEVSLFFQKGQHPIVGDEKLNVLSKKLEYQGSRPIPLRFSVLTGEIIHHFRSSLDHLAWLLASSKSRNETPTRIEFPIFLNPFNKDGSPSLKGKIEMIANEKARKIIERVQPYKGIDPPNDMLWIVHDLDRIYKHRELLMTETGFRFESKRLNALINFYAANPSLQISPDIARELQQDMRVTASIAFRDFRQGNPQPVIPMLSQLETEVRHVIGLFDGEWIKC